MNKYTLIPTILLLVLNLSAQVNLDSSLIGYWPFNGTTDDLSSLEHHAINNGCEPVADFNGRDDKAYEFDGISNSMEIPYSYSELTIPFTISAWVYKRSSGDFTHIFSSSSDVTNYYGVYFAIDRENQLQITYCDGGIGGSGSRRTKESDASIPLDEWVPLVAVVNGPDDMVLQIGCEVQEGDYSGFGGDMVNGDGPALVGSAAHNSAFWNGSIDEVRLYNRALSAEEVDFLCAYDAISSTENLESTVVDIFPNPTNQFIEVKSEISFKEFEIVDVEGKVVLNDKLDASSTRIDVSAIASGVYVLQLIQGDARVAKKFIKVE